MYNDTKTIYQKKLYVGMQNYKKMYVELEIHQEAETRTKKTTELKPITAYKTLSICGNGGQNIEETADISKYTELFISKDDLKAIIEIWEKWHLNDMKAGTVKQQAFIDEWIKTNRYNYTAACEALKAAGLYIDNDYQYGHEWLVDPLPEDVITEITGVFEKYNNAEHTEQQTNTATFKQFKVKAVFKGDKAATWSKDNYNNHLVTVTNTDNKQRCTFEFWASIADPEIKTEHDILNAFSCFVGDAVSGNMSFDEFCSEFGYDTDSRTAEKTWKACKHSSEKLERIYDGDIYELANELQEAAD
jgi:hypothetical protein